MSEILKERTYLRGIALQALYEKELTDHAVEEIINNRFETIDFDAESKAFIRQLIQGVAQNQEQIDRLITSKRRDWSFDDMALVDRNILRIAVYEFGVAKCTPVEVSINESVELAKKFGSETSPRFVNGMLRAIASDR